MAIEALILALDGVIFDTEQAHLAACNAAFADCSLTLRWTIVQYREAARRHGAHHAAAAACHGPGDTQARRLLEHAAQHFREQMREMPSAPHPGCAALLNEAIGNGCKLAVVTDMPVQTANALLQQWFGNDVNNTFAVVVGGARFAESGASSPHLLALRTMGVEAERCVAIDAAAPGLHAAQRAGIWTMAATPYAKDVARIDGADLWCPQMQELRDHIGTRAATPRAERYVGFDTLRSLRLGQLGQRPVLRRTLRPRRNA